MARPRNQPVEAVRAAALEVFWREGYEATSLSLLEEATATGRRSLLNSFGDKLGLFVLLLQDFRAQAAAQMLAPMEAEGAGLEGIRESLARLVAAGISPAGAKGCMICNTARDAIAREPAVRAEIDLYFARIKGAARTALDTAAAQGQLDPGRDRASLSAFLLGVVVAICTLARAGAAEETLRSLEREALAHLGVAPCR
ncbi:MAG: TetR family transcriptional regulator [Pseudomonadota bacterium]